GAWRKSSRTTPAKEVGIGRGALLQRVQGQGTDPLSGYCSFHASGRRLPPHPQYTGGAFFCGAGCETSGTTIGPNGLNGVAGKAVVRACTTWWCRRETPPPTAT